MVALSSRGGLILRRSMTVKSKEVCMVENDLLVDRVLTWLSSGSSLMDRFTVMVLVFLLVPGKEPGV